MSWTFEHSADSTAGPQQVWPHYADVENWPRWSPAIEWVRLAGPFEVGTKGRTKAHGFPAGSFRVTAADPGRLYASETRLPGARLRFEHQIEPIETGVRITHRGSLSGPLAFLYLRRIRGSTEKNLPAGVERLAALAGDDE